jgi:regulator of PEP synthase PpsR (kinase-PPPase family)
MIAKAALAQFDDADIVRQADGPLAAASRPDHGEIAANPGLVLFTLVNAETRERLEQRCAALGLPSVAALDAVTDALEEQLGQEAKARPAVST